jgi:hypothetical protein
MKTFITAIALGLSTTVFAPAFAQPAVPSVQPEQAAPQANQGLEVQRLIDDLTGMTATQVESIFPDAVQTVYYTQGHSRTQGKLQKTVARKEVDYNKLTLMVMQRLVSHDNGLQELQQQIDQARQLGPKFE